MHRVCSVKGFLWSLFAGAEEGKLSELARATELECMYACNSLCNYPHHNRNACMHDRETLRKCSLALSTARNSRWKLHKSRAKWLSEVVGTFVAAAAVGCCWINNIHIHVHNHIVSWHASELMKEFSAPFRASTKFVCSRTRLIMLISWLSSSFYCYSLISFSSCCVYSVEIPFRKLSTPSRCLVQCKFIKDFYRNWFSAVAAREANCSQESCWEEVFADVAWATERERRSQADRVNLLVFHFFLSPLSRFASRAHSFLCCRVNGSNGNEKRNSFTNACILTCWLLQLCCSSVSQFHFSASFYRQRLFLCKLELILTNSELTHLQLTPCVISNWIN